MSEPEHIQELHDPEIDSLTVALLSAETGASFRRTRRSLEARPRDEVIAALIRAMHRAANQRDFDRSAKLLAEYGGDAAAQALASAARSQRQYPRLAMRAFARCQHPIVVPTLLDLLANGRIKQRRAAAYALARLRTPLAIEPLARAASVRSGDIAPEALEALRSIGRPDQIARLALSTVNAVPADHVRILMALAACPLREGFWRASPFDPRRFLDKESQDPRSPVASQARSAAEFLQMQSTLLRGLDSAHPDTLLRAAESSGSSAPDTLLRASGLTHSEGTGPLDRGAFAGKALSPFLTLAALVLRLMRRPRNTQ